MATTRRTFLGAVAAAGVATASRRILGANDRVQVGFIGYGLIGKQHVYDCKNLGDVDLVGVSDTYQPRIEEGIAACGGRARAYSDFRKMLDDKDIQAVIVSTPDHWHALMTIMACAAGKDVYVEKPQTLFVQEGRWMVKAARHYKRIVQCGSQQRSGIHYTNAVRRMQEGEIGKIHTVRIGTFRNIMPGFGNPQDTDPPPGLDYDMWLGPAPLRTYNPGRCIYHFRWFWDYSGGQMTNYGAHDVDIVHWALQVNAPTAVASAGGRLALEDSGETPDTEDAIFEYPDHFTMQWTCREASVGRGQGGGMEYFGTKGSLFITRGGYEIIPDMKGDPVNQVPRIMGHPVGGVVYHPEVKETPWTEAVKEKVSNPLWASHMRNFIDCVKSRQKPNADVEDGHRTATACHLANISLRLGRKIEWDAEHERVVGDPEAEAWLWRPYRPPWDQVLKSIDLG